MKAILRYRTRPRVRLIFYSRVMPSGCWEWISMRDNKGYGRISVGMRRMFAHRLSYETFAGPIPNGLHIDHLCRNRACINPGHLEPVTLMENVSRGPCSPTKTHCANGHEFTPENTYMRPDRPRHRCCRACNAAAQARRKARRVGVAA